ncbi:MAG: DUF5723 family protein [Bacteroidota bacterium]|nr:DUF5723 family protein [Bacteroidota bacterium]
MWTYEFNARYSLGLLFYAEGHKEVNPALNAYIQRKFGKALNLGFSYAIKNKLFNNFGMSASYTRRKLQAVCATDNFPCLFKLKDSKNVNFRWGLNDVFK